MSCIQAGPATPSLNKSLEEFVRKAYLPPLHAVQSFDCVASPQCHVSPVSAQEFELRVFQPISPSWHYHEGMFEDKRRKIPIEIILPLLMHLATLKTPVYTYGLICKNFAHKKYNELERFGAYSPHFTIFALPVCNLSSEACVKAAKKILSELLGKLIAGKQMNIDFPWPTRRPYTTCSGQGVCQVCGKAKGFEYCPRFCGFGYVYSSRTELSPDPVFHYGSIQLIG